jgi:ubiquinone/menaquinone biosynthesis C-methylase UbiE
MNEENKVILDVAAGTGTFAAWMSMVPDFVALLTGVWVLIRIIETDSIKAIIKKIQGKNTK